MKSWIEEKISACVGQFSVGAHTASGMRLLMYHSVGGEAIGDKFGMYSVAPKQFKQHMTMLLGAKHLSVVQLTEEALSSTENRISITFDDGYNDNLEVAAPILSELGFPATFFVTAEMVRSNMRNFLSEQSLRELATLPGVQIGSHGLTHRPLARCEGATLYNELSSSKKYLEDVIGKEVFSISYPHGSVSDRVTEIAQIVGYRLGACSIPGINRKIKNTMLLSRTEIHQSDTLDIFNQKISGNWDWLRLKHIFKYS